MNGTYAVIAEVNITDISSNDFFKVSRKNYPVTLTVSLKNSGMLEYPYVIKSKSGYTPLTCHNRIEILRETGISSVNCFILEKPDLNMFIKNVSLKMYRNELGPSGRLKVFSLLSSCFNLEENVRYEFCIKVLKLPYGFLKDDKLVKKTLEFPESLLNYLDEKDISFKIIKDISLLPVKWISVIDNWINKSQVRINIFRMLIEHLFDIYRRGDDVTIIESISFSDDKSLYDAVYRARFPEYSKRKIESDEIINELNETGLMIEFPEYFDRGTVTIRLDVDKRTDCSLQIKKISKLNVDKLNKLLSYL